MASKTNEFAHRLMLYPGDQTEAEWLNAFEFLRLSLSNALSTHVHIGSYYINDFPKYASASGCARIRARTSLPGIISDSWEGILAWSGNRISQAYASALIFPFQNESVMQPQGRYADLGTSIEVDRYLLYKFEDGTFVNSGWHVADGSGEWADVTVPGTIYSQDLIVNLPSTTFASNAPIYVDLSIPELLAVRSHSSANARISLIHANRNREGTNLSPWTVSLPLNTAMTQTLADAKFPAANVLRIRLDAFNIRGGWIAGKYYLSLRVQNFHKPTDWAWTSAISKPFELTII